MDKLFQNSLGEKSEHPPREILLLFVDGELAAKEATQLETHLEACWACRVKTKKIQETIADIIEFDEQVLTPRIVPPQGWRNFDRRLNQLVAASGKQSLSTRLFGSINRFLPSSRFLSLPRLSFTPLVVRAVVAVLLVGLIATLVIRLNREPTVSASELLRNAIDAQSRQIEAIDQPVLHQKLLVRRKADNSASEESVSWEIWNDANGWRVRHFIANGSQSTPVTGSISSTNSQQKGSTQNESSDAQFILDLARVLQTNHMDPQRPLSAASYQSWHTTLHNHQDDVLKSKFADGSDALTLRTVPAYPLNIGEIAEAQFVVRAGDWQPAELHLTVVAEGGNRVYELSQQISEVVTLAHVDPSIFADQPMASTSPVANPKENSKTKLSPELANNTQPLTPALATTDLEVQVLQLLHEARADLGEQVAAVRGDDGLLRVTGVVDTADRKAEIVRALHPVADNPAVRIQIQTVAEAVAQQQQQRKRSSSPTVREGSRSVTEQEVEINSEAIAAAPELRRHFQSDEQVREFAARMVNQSNRAMRHVYAMKRLLGQFSTEELRAMSPDAKNKWLSLIRSHASAYRTEAAGIRSDLQPIYPNASGVAESAGEISDDVSLIRAVNRLFDLASGNDSAIRSSFAMSSASKVSSVGSQQFWQSMKSAEALAARIQTAH